MEDAHIALMPGQNSDEIMCWEYIRTVHNDWAIRFENQLLLIQKTRHAHVRPKQKVILKRHLNGKITLWNLIVLSDKELKNKKKLENIHNRHEVKTLVKISQNPPGVNLTLAG